MKQPTFNKTGEQWFPGPYHSTHPATMARGFGCRTSWNVNI